MVARYQLPGIAVGVIANGKVIYRRAAGTLQSGQPINAETLFKIASNSKAMTATTLARLVQQGKLAWDDPVTKYLPDFQMYDPWVTKNMQVGDLLVHHSGLPEGGGDLMLWPNPNHFTRSDVIHGLRYIKPAYSFRAGYAYDNLLYVVAGELAAAAGGAPYAQLVRREVFQPLGMSRCQIGTWDRERVGNVAQPHSRRDGHNVIIDADGAVVHPTTMGAAGGIRCSLDDMLTWAMNWLAPTQKQLEWLAPAQRRKEWTTYTPMPISKRRRAWNGTRFYGYGYGWRIADVDGEMTVSHTGTLSGMYSAMTLLPFRQSGFVILINSDARNARTVLNEVLIKHFIAPSESRSVASYADELARTNRARHASRVPDTSSRQPATPTDVTDNLGIWHDPWFGDVSICPHDGHVRFVSAMSPILSGDVMRLGDRYLVHWDHGDAEAWLRFPDQRGGVLHMAKVDPDADFSYDYEDLAFARERACSPLVGTSSGTRAANAALSMVPRTRQAEVDALMSRYAGEVPGASLLVILDGKALIRRGYGYANLEQHIKASPASNYRLASVTKQFTAAAILLLKQDSKLRLDDSVRQWLPELPASDAKITISDLLTHTSGLIDYEDLMAPDRSAQLNDADVLRLIAGQDRLYFSPGSDYRYSNGGYVLLGLIVERASGMKLPAFLKQRIFAPLGMNHTLMYEHHRGPQVRHRAYGYSFVNGQWTRSDQSLTSATRGDGGIYSSIDDLAKWDAALYDDRLLNDESRRLAFTAHTPTDNPDVGYGFGWRITGDSVWHSGESMGFRNVIVRWPKQHLTVVILSNRRSPKPYPTALAIGQLYLPHEAH